MKKYILILLLFSFGTHICHAQQGIQYTQFMFNKLHFNPAYAGGKGHLCLSAIYRKQWIGIDRAPQSATFNAHGAVWKKRVGLGLSLSYDQIGFTDRVSFETNYSYIIRFENKSFLSIGLRGSAYYSQMRWDQVDLIDNVDNTIPQSNTSQILPNFGAGVYYQSKNWYLGISVPHIFRNQGDFNITSLNQSIIEPDFTQHYYGMAGFVFDIAKNVELQQNMLLKYVVGTPLSMDINLSLVFFKKVLVGVTYRVGDSVDAMLQWRITPQLGIAMAYDFSVTDLQQYNSGSVEAMVTYQFYKPSEEEESPSDTTKYKYENNHRFF